MTNDQITKGYQYEPDRYAIVEPDDVAKIKIKTTKAVDIVGFVERSEIPTTFYDAPYFAVVLVPGWENRPGAKPGGES